MTAASALGPLALLVKKAALSIEWYKLHERPWSPLFGRSGWPIVPDIFWKNHRSTWDIMQEIAMFLTFAISAGVTISLFLRKRKLEGCSHSHNPDDHSN